MIIIVTKTIFKMDLSSGETLESSLNNDEYLSANSSNTGPLWLWIPFKLRYVSTISKILDLSHDALNKGNCVTPAFNT